MHFDTLMAREAQSNCVDLAALVKRYGRPGPRYTSYPTAVHLDPKFDRERALAELRSNDERYGIYLHVPFCERRCLYCACHTTIARDRELGKVYVDGLLAEIELLADATDLTQPLRFVHLGGGTPTWLAFEDMERLVAAIKTAAGDPTDTAWSIEVDPETVDIEDVNRLIDLGYGRMSFGVQDLDSVVARAVGRRHRPNHLAKLCQQLRKRGVSRYNFDLIYGLPHQDQVTIRSTIDRVVGLGPSRVALYGYAHVPWMMRHQRGLERLGLPGPNERLAMFMAAGERLLDHGYVAIGMDHFALPDDPLAIAARSGTMRRSFMGYTTSHCDSLLGLGVSSIGGFGHALVQNEKDMVAWRKRIDAGELPWAKALFRNRDDEIRAHVIERLMCDMRLPKRAVEKRLGIEFDEYFADANQRLQALAADGLVRSVADDIEVTQTGQLFLRNVAMAFDTRLRPKPEGQHAMTV